LFGYYKNEWNGMEYDGIYSIDSMVVVTSVNARKGGTTAGLSLLVNILSVA
jgi:hypothetical protein